MILIVDDDAVFRQSVRNVLEIEDYKVIDVDDGLNALPIVEKGNVDLVITDILMPEIEGNELAARIKKINPDLKVIGMTGGGHIGDADYVEKICAKRLFETIARTISEDQVSLPHEVVLSKLIAREKLGSTGLGKGVAIPHCRVDNCTHAFGTLITLEEAMDFDAPDGEPVDILFALLVPEEEHQQHLDILAGLARLFSEREFCSRIRREADASSLYSTATTWSP